MVLTSHIFQCNWRCYCFFCYQRRRSKKSKKLPLSWNNTCRNTGYFDYSSFIDWNNYSATFSGYARHALHLVARPRFELGSRAPKAPMLDRYIRWNSSTGLPGAQSSIKFLYNVIWDSAKTFDNISIQKINNTFYKIYPIIWYYLIIEFSINRATRNQNLTPDKNWIINNQNWHSLA